MKYTYFVFIFLNFSLSILFGSDTYFCRMIAPNGYQTHYSMTLKSNVISTQPPGGIPFKMDGQLEGRPRSLSFPSINYRETSKGVYAKTNPYKNPGLLYFTAGITLTMAYWYGTYLIENFNKKKTELK